MNLFQLKKGQVGRITALSGANDDMVVKLRELGLNEGDEVELIAFGPIARQPVAVRLNRSLIALRRVEAEAVEIAVEAPEIKIAAE